MDPYIGDIRIFAGNFAPVGWMLCNGALLDVGTYGTLYALIGTTYGGDGASTFALPDLRGRLPVGAGTGAGLTPRVMGEIFGSESVTLLTTQIPSHSHALIANSAASTASGPTNNLFAANTADPIYTQLPASPVPQTMNGATVQQAGGSQPHDNIMSSTAINYIICIDGIFPSRN